VSDGTVLVREHPSSCEDWWPAPQELLRRARGENFVVASLLVGKRTARHLRAVYLFARLVDECGDSAPGERLLALDRVESELNRAASGSSRDPVFRELGETMRECELPRSALARLIEANREDQRRPEYETYDELLAYCDLSANPVGELVLHVFGAATPARIALSNSVCTALQLIEHWQDVREDALHGRIYLPGEDRRRFGVERLDLVQDRAGEPLRRLLELEAHRAAELLSDGARLVATLSGRARLAVAGYVGGGHATLAAIERAGYDVLAAVPRASKLQRTIATGRVLAT